MICKRALETLDAVSAGLAPKVLFTVVFNLARLDQKDEEIRIAKEKFEAAEKRLAATAKTVGDEKLTDEQRVGPRRIRTAGEQMAEWAKSARACSDRVMS